MADVEVTADNFVEEVAKLRLKIDRLMKSLNEANEDRYKAEEKWRAVVEKYDECREDKEAFRDMAKHLLENV
jgi:hypothetical protein